MNIQTKVTSLGQKAVDLGLAHHYHFEIVGKGPVPDEVTQNLFWTLIPVKYPPRGHDRIKVLTDAGIEIIGYIIAEEPEVVEVQQPTPKVERDFKVTPSIPASEIANVAGAILMGVLTVAGFVLFACLKDPMLIVVLEDDTWVCIESWYS